MRERPSESLSLTPPLSPPHCPLLIRGPQWDPGSIRPYGNLELSPSAAVLNYGQGVFEGMKAYRTAKGRVVRCARPAEAAPIRIGSPAPPSALAWPGLACLPRPPNTPSLRTHP